MKILGSLMSKQHSLLGTIHEYDNEGILKVAKQSTRVSSDPGEV